MGKGDDSTNLTLKRVVRRLISSRGAYQYMIIPVCVCVRVRACVCVCVCKRETELVECLVVG